jgi:hypothetical protein
MTDFRIIVGGSHRISDRRLISESVFFSGNNDNIAEMATGTNTSYPTNFLAAHCMSIYFIVLSTFFSVLGTYYYMFIVLGSDGTSYRL